MQVIEVNNATGTAPYDVYICDVTITYCYLVGTGITSFPSYFDLPPFLNGSQSVIVKLIDSNGCEIFYNIGCLQPTPSVTITPSFTPTPTPTPTRPLYPCECITFDNSGSGDNIGYNFINCNGILISDVVPSGQTRQVCGSNPVSLDNKMSYTISGNCIDGVCQNQSVCVAPMEMSTILGVTRIYLGCSSGYNPIDGTCVAPGTPINIGSNDFDGGTGCNQYNNWSIQTNPAVKTTSFKVEGVNITSWTQLQIGMRVYKTNTVPGGTCLNYQGGNIWVNRNSLQSPYIASVGKPIIVRIYQPVLGGPYYILNITDCT